MNAIPPAYEELDHTADLAIRVHGADLAELFLHAAQGLFALMRPEPADPLPTVSHCLDLEAGDVESLLVAWLNELCYLCEREKGCYNIFQMITLTPTRLVARVEGFRGCARQRGIKAATFHDLAVRRSATGYTATITFDV